MRGTARVLSLIRQNPAVHASLLYAFGGIGFALGTLFLAKALPADDFAATVLVLAIAQVAMRIGPLGADVIIDRHPVNPAYDLLVRIILSSSVVALLCSIVSGPIYGLSAPVLFQLFLICTLSGLNVVGSALLRNRQRFFLALLITQSQNFALLLIAGFFIANESGSALAALWLISGCLAISCLAGWLAAFRIPGTPSVTPLADFPWNEGRTILGTAVAVILLIQIERLLIPNLLGQSALALYAVLGAVAASPFRVLQMAVGFTMVPRLRSAQTATAQRRLLASEAKLLIILAILASATILTLTRPFVHWILEGKYEISYALIGAAICAGWAKVASAFATAGVTALGARDDLARLNRLSWLALVCAGITGASGSILGLAGLMLGVAVGWGFHAATSIYWLRVVLHQRNDVA